MSSGDRLKDGVTAVLVVVLVVLAALAPWAAAAPGGGEPLRQGVAVTVAGRRLVLVAARNVAGRPGDRIGKNVADLRARRCRRRDRDRQAGDEGRHSGQDKGSMHLARLFGGESGGIVQGSHSPPLARDG